MRKQQFTSDEACVAALGAAMRTLNTGMAAAADRELRVELRVTELHHHGSRWPQQHLELFVAKDLTHLTEGVYVRDDEVTKPEFP